jgi:3-hydroxyacyl-[acyl-carrier-protein] dehydratase
MEQQQAIHEAIPHRDPFLWVDEILERTDSRIICRKTFSGEEDFFRGHYPGRPVVPGVILCEAAIQAGAILLGEQFAQCDGRMPVVARIKDARFRRIVRPGETIRIEVDFEERLADAFFLTARVDVDGTVAARFEFACTAAVL